MRDLLQQRGQDGEDQADADGIEHDDGEDDGQRALAHGRRRRRKGIFIYSI